MTRRDPLLGFFAGFDGAGRIGPLGMMTFSKSEKLFVIEDIIWMESVLEKLTWKHGILPYEVEEVLSSKCKIFKKEKGKVEGEHLYNALGKTDSGRYLSVFFIRKMDNKALIVTARVMNKRERKRYASK